MKLSAARCVTSLLLLGAAHGAGIGSQHVLSNNHHGASGSSLNSGNSQLFPFLTKLRDGAIEFFFGRHPAKAAASHSTPRENLHSRYTNELVLRFNVSTTDEEAALAEAASRLFLDIWAFTDDFVDIRLHSDVVAPLLGLLPKSLQSSHSTLIPDLAAAVYHSLPLSEGPAIVEPDGSAPLLLETLKSGNNLFFQDFQPLNVIVRWMKLLEAMFPSYVKYITVGKSFEGREIPALRVGVPNIPNGRPRKTIIVTGGLHAREWISTSTVNYVAWSYITSFGKEPMITRFLAHYDIVFMPVLNPDGVEYTWQVDRLWRKSRQSAKLRFCRGIDLDHAFGFGWNTAETQNDPCSESYGGEEPFQAVEALQLSGWARNETQNNVEIVGLLDLHSYSQQVLFPYSYTCAAEPPNLENLQELAAGLAKAIRLSNGESYSVTSACEGAVAATESGRHPVWPRIESGGGSAIDWFYHELRAHFSYQIKLRDTGSYGFLLPKEYIIPTGEEMFNAMKYFGDYLLGNNGIEKVSTDDEENVARFEEGGELPTSQELRRRRLRR
ncbi:Inactive metallocarboxypeptidase ecm14 [Cladobotryum mycophilum]|uniref:Inactive metallocarboxypeptidase ECM14 n=1 Tax=Cladobotryum mycophilum TaxID=491253 RepID=A0ABR0SV01_9HYPO